MVLASKKVEVPADRIYQTVFGINYCKDPYSGPECQLNCPGGRSLSEFLLISDDLNKLEKLNFACSNKGKCQNGVCQCDENTSGETCEINNCPNNCSNDEISEPEFKSQCIQGYPESYCRCSEASKRGGDDCSVIFCLNECGSGGKCQKGSCECKPLHHGPDCSILEIELSLE